MMAGSLSDFNLICLYPNLSMKFASLFGTQLSEAPFDDTTIARIMLVAYSVATSVLTRSVSSASPSLGDMKA